MTAPRSASGRRSPSARDVALLAGVSVATVSLVVNDKAEGRVSPRRQDAVRRAVSQLGYRVDTRARELVTGLSSTVALVLPELSSSYFGDLVMGVGSVLEGRCELVVVCAAGGSPPGKEHLERVLDARVGGVICHAAGRWASTLPRELAESAVLLDEPGTAWPGPAAGFDLASGAASLAEHLLALGHRSIAYLNPVQDSATFRARRRLLVARLRAGAPCRLVELHSGIDIDSAAEAVGAAAASGSLSGVSAIVCATDDQAYGALLALAERGVAVPDEVSVAGFNDLPLSRVVRPALTTVALPARELGSAGAELLLRLRQRQRNGQPRSASRVLVPTRLLVRHSTGPAGSQR